MSVAVAAGVGMSIISSEHFFSTFLSSPWTTAKFVETEEDKRSIRRLYMMATATSLIASAIIAGILKQWWPVIAAAVLSLMYILVYEKSMNGGI